MSRYSESRIVTAMPVRRGDATAILLERLSVKLPGVPKFVQSVVEKDGLSEPPPLCSGANLDQKLTNFP
jgi:hypothetical protein